MKCSVLFRHDIFAALRCLSPAAYTENVRHVRAARIDMLSRISGAQTSDNVTRLSLWRGGPRRQQTVCAAAAPRDPPVSNRVALHSSRRREQRNNENLGIWHILHRGAGAVGTCETSISSRARQRLRMARVAAYQYIWTRVAALRCVCAAPAAAGTSWRRWVASRAGAFRSV